MKQANIDVSNSYTTNDQCTSTEVNQAICMAEKILYTNHDAVGIGIVLVCGAIGATILVRFTVEPVVDAIIKISKQMSKK